MGIKSIIYGVAGIVAVLPGLDYLVDGPLVPEVEHLKSIALLIAQVLSFAVVSVFLVNRNKYVQRSGKSFVRWMIFFVVGALVSVSAYSFTFSHLIVRAQVPEYNMIEPLWQTPFLEAQLEEYPNGTIQEFVAHVGIDGYAMLLQDDSETATAVLFSNIVLILLYVLSIVFVVSVTLWGAIRLERFSPEVGAATPAEE